MGSRSKSRILVVLEHGNTSATSQVKALIYRNLFAQHGFEVLYLNRYLSFTNRFRHGPNKLVAGVAQISFHYLFALLNRLYRRIQDARIIRIARHCDTVFLVRVPSSKLCLDLRNRTNARIVFDFEDALWLPHFSEFANGQLYEILGAAHAVTCENEYIADFVRRYNSNTFILPAVAPIHLFDHYRDRVKKSQEIIVLGWIGSPSTVNSLYAIWDPLERLFGMHDNILLRLVGVGHDQTLLPHFEKVRLSILPYYSQVEMVEEVLKMNIGLFPMFDNENSWARGALKAKMYMSGEAATVCQGIGECNKVVADGINGMLANSAEEWLEKMEVLVTDRNLRKEIASRGLETIRQHYTPEKSFDTLIEVLLNSVGTKI